MGATAKVLNFEGVTEGSEFRPRRKPEGDYYGTITAVKDHKSGKTGDDMWCFTVKVHGDARAAYPYYCGYDADSLWKVRGLFVAAGIKVPGKRLKADPNKLIGKVIGIALVDDEYEGRPKSTIDAVFPADDMDDPMNERSGKASSTKAKSRAAEDDDVDDDDDDEPAAPVRNKGKAKKAAPVEDDDDDDDDDDDEPPAKPAKGKSKVKAKSVEDDDDEDEDDEDDDEPPAKSKKASKGKSKGKRKPADDDDDELDLDEL